MSPVVAPPQVVELEAHAPDVRGLGFSVPALCLEHLGHLGDVHVASIEPGHVRGDHFHLERREMILVLPHDRWTLYWDEGEGTPPHSRAFLDASATAVLISPSCAHAVENDGARAMWIVAVSDGAYDPDAPDAHRRVVSG
jgi:oxalate decarboxylase/phosphoglucose isomerase-like protein (cupin superfamily)